jgi:uncharacterized protein (TIGR02996 family)
MNPAKAEAAFLESIGEQPDDDSPRLIYADWLRTTATRHGRSSSASSAAWRT